MQNVLNTDKRINIVGLGQTGYSCARYLASLNKPFRCFDSRQNPALKADYIQQFGSETLFCGAMDKDGFDAQDLLIVSPGIALYEPFIEQALAKGAQLSSDIALFMQAIDKPVVAITGSNGKSTVTTLVAQMLNAAGLKAIAAGNIGLPVLDCLSDKLDADVYVLELSSFQLERVNDLAPTVATVLNISEDHMDRYASLEAYKLAKERIYQGAQVAVLNRQENNPALAMRSISFALDKPAPEQFGLNQGFLCYGDKPLLAVKDMLIKGSHNQANALAALALCKALAVAPERVVNVLTQFQGLAHRCQYVASIKQVQFYDDSKATNTGAAIAAIEGLKTQDNRIVLIAGGLDKDSDFSQMAEVVKQSCRTVILIGQDGPKISRALGDFSQHTAQDMNQAVELAFQSASAGDVVLLAPACASFDMFNSYKHRGDCFVAAVRQLEASYA